MSQLRTLNARRAVKKMDTANGNTARDFTLALVQSKISQRLPPKEIVRQFAKRRLVPRN